MRNITNLENFFRSCIRIWLAFLVGGVFLASCNDDEDETMVAPGGLRYTDYVEAVEQNKDWTSPEPQVFGQGTFSFAIDKVTKTLPENEEGEEETTPREEDIDISLLRLDPMTGTISIEANVLEVGEYKVGVTVTNEIGSFTLNNAIELEILDPLKANISLSATEAKLMVNPTSKLPITSIWVPIALTNEKGAAITVEPDGLLALDEEGRYVPVADKAYEPGEYDITFTARLAEHLDGSAKLKLIIEELGDPEISVDPTEPHIWTNKEGIAPGVGEGLSINAVGYSALTVLGGDGEEHPLFEMVETEGKIELKAKEGALLTEDAYELTLRASIEGSENPGLATLTLAVKRAAFELTATEETLPVKQDGVSWLPRLTTILGDLNMPDDATITLSDNRFMADGNLIRPDLTKTFADAETIALTITLARGESVMQVSTLTVSTETKADVEFTDLFTMTLPELADEKAKVNYGQPEHIGEGANFKSGNMEVSIIDLPDGYVLAEDKLWWQAKHISATPRNAKSEQPTVPLGPSLVLTAQGTKLTVLNDSRHIVASEAIDVQGFNKLKMSFTAYMDFNCNKFVGAIADKYIPEPYQWIQVYVVPESEYETAKADNYQTLNQSLNEENDVWSSFKVDRMTELEPLKYELFQDRVLETNISTDKVRLVFMFENQSKRFKDKFGVVDNKRYNIGTMSVSDLKVSAK
ncbi:hypothetical protein FUAX_19200 [Fulvitalea axinellae]|uniref:Uncharacterized protein n=1 Tax=Fulvitalea axinellae TaxID=1182444 RepID=A0AAU9D0Q6_9BACT|nr:hypothetical protein FUAX_19200 [Fulvitalea axinellae]